MKTKTKFRFVHFLLATCLAGFTHADENGTTASVKLSSPDQPGALQIDLPWADLHITGVDGDTVTVVSTLKQQGSDKSRDGGLRRLDGEASFDLTEQANTVNLRLVSNDPMAGGTETIFNVSVPRALALAVGIAHGGTVTVKDVTGDIEVNNTNGEVHLDGITGSAIVNTMNGEVRANYAAAPQKPVAITSMNGEVELRVPAETKANVQLRTQNGSIYTDFDNAKLKTKSESKRSGRDDDARAMADAARMRADADRANADALRSTDTPQVPRPPRPPAPPFFGGKLVSGTLNGGGTDIRISNMNGKITLRQTKATVSSADSTKDNVTVLFQDPDNFTDIDEDFPGDNSAAYLEMLRDYVQKTAAPLLPAGGKLTVTFTDIDLAGMIRPDKNNVRVITSTTIPRAHLKFQLLDAGGHVIKEGERRLSDLNFQYNINIIGRNDELFHDKELLKDWILREFKRGS